MNSLNSHNIKVPLYISATTVHDLVADLSTQISVPNSVLQCKKNQ
jgi:hypothetical protein